MDTRCVVLVDEYPDGLRFIEYDHDELPEPGYYLLVRADLSVEAIAEIVTSFNDGFAADETAEAIVAYLVGTEGAE